MLAYAAETKKIHNALRFWKSGFLGGVALRKNAECYSRTGCRVERSASSATPAFFGARSSELRATILCSLIVPVDAGGKHGFESRKVEIFTYI